MNDILSRILLAGVLPTVSLHGVEEALPLCGALAAGEMSAVLIDGATPWDPAALAAMSGAMPKLLVGACHIQTADQARQAMAAGAKILLTEGDDPQVMGCAQGADCLVIPCVPSLEAVPQGAEVAGICREGGVVLVRPTEMSQPLPTCPVNNTSLSRYLTRPGVLAVAGDWLCSGRDWPVVTASCKGAVKAMLNMKLLHMGVNCADSQEAARVAQRFAAVLDLEYRPGPASDFAGTLVETTRGDGRGTHGHIAIGVDHVARAVRVLEGRGIEFDEASAKLDGKGQVRVIYLKEEIGGFAVHLGRNG